MAGCVPSYRRLKRDFHSNGIQFHLKRAAMQAKILQRVNRSLENMELILDNMFLAIGGQGKPSSAIAQFELLRIIVFI